MKVETTFDKERTEFIINLVEQKKFNYLKEIGIRLTLLTGSDSREKKQ